ncbi:MAG TPA: TIGR00730 family Rossman fold protein [Rhizomicrobium sp.]|nr:TIGR00730 family Rossman fold protein [Rhizomicrobium sp.]
MRICVYAGSSMGRSGVYREAAQALGALLAQESIGLVYGGGNIGLMGVAADSALTAGGEVVGVITEQLNAHGLGHARLTRLHVVPTMHDRKAKMAELSDAFIALPGGIGTFEELFEVWTWSQLGVHAKPVGLLNAAGFYDTLAEFLDHVVDEKFLKPLHRNTLVIEADPRLLLKRLREAEVPYAPKWLDTVAVEAAVDTPKD